MNVHWHEEENPINNKVLHKETGKILLKINPKFYRPAEVELLLGDPTEAQDEIKWQKKVDFDSLVSRMIKNDIKESKGNIS